MAVGTHLHKQHCSKTTQVFLPVDGEASWLLLLSLISCTVWVITIREHMFLYDWDDRSDLKSKKDKIQCYS